ncbi:MAG: 50S ribosomal protein L17 [Propionibacteriaceae bacterium]|jgi:large subunit ribosomal protein L17|nr:50S ribosomal protein L17 [Propionibacteriaceae bacterium]
MPKPTKGPRLGGTPTHQRIILANLATQLFEHGRITTTETRAKRLQPLAERLISKAKRGDLHSRRIVMRTVTDPTVVHVLFTEIAPQVADRDGGCTRITKIGPRKGDNAPMAIIEIVTEAVTKKTRSKKAEPAKKAEEVVEVPVEAEVAEAQADDEVVEVAEGAADTDAAAEVADETAETAQTAEESDNK